MAKNSSKKVKKEDSYIAYKFQLLPNDKQEELICKTFGCCRKVWNLMLADREDYYAKYKKTLKVTPAQYKSAYPYLKEVDSQALSNVQLNLETAYSNFRDKISKKPKFKTRATARRSYSSCVINNNIKVDTKKQKIQCPKLGWVSFNQHRDIPSNLKLKKITISQDGIGKFYISLCYEYPKVTLNYQVDETKAIGLDYKSDGFYVDSEGNTAGSPKWYRKYESKLARQQRRLSRKIGFKKGEEKSKGFRKQLIKVNKIHRKIANKRNDFCHKQSKCIADNYDIVCVEDLDLKAISNKGFKNGKATLDNGFGKFRIQLQNKLEKQGKKFIKIDKYYPSSQTCHCCGYKNADTKNLKIRKWTCPNCNATHDRDINAAINIKIEGLRLYKNEQ